METKTQAKGWAGFLQHPITRFFAALFMVATPVMIAQIVIEAFDFDLVTKNVILIAASVFLIIGMYSLYVRAFEKRAVSEFGLQGAARELGSGILLGALLFGSVVAVLALSGMYRVDGLNSPSVLLIPFMISVFSGLFEEVLMRGILFRILEDSLGSWFALAISAVIFGALHLLNEHATVNGAVAIMLEAGILLAAAYMFTRRLWFAIGIHFAWNFTQGGIFGITISGNEPMAGLLRSSLNGPEWLTGGAFGAEASVIAVVVCLLAGVYLLARAHQKGNFIAPF
jgi:membrane protease YdiL (CAAX protease family)